MPQGGFASPSGMKGTAGTLPCLAAERGHQVTAPHAFPLSRARFAPVLARLKCRERASVIWKVILPPLAEGRRAEEEGEEAVLGVGLHMSLFGKTRFVL